ncbi:MAG: MATE family efflux transporter [Clostridiales bacterium]|nr:MATE family efflux transporter [Clostridiales bacterium]
MSTDNRISRKSIDMLSPENLTGKIIKFVLPILACGIVQQSFNAVDIAVVGRFVGHEALAAVGANGPVIGLIINLFMGLSLGSNVIIANLIGQRNREGIRKAVATSAALALISGVVMMMIGLTIAGPILALLETPVEVIDKATEYLTILSLGFPGMMIYNFGSAILRSVGDTKRPFYCLVAGGLVNVILNLTFVLGFGMGVEGVAIATSISNYVSGMCIVWLLFHETGDIRLNPHCIKLFHKELGKIIRIGLPAGIQGMVFALSNVFVQSGINSFGHETVSGSAAALTFEFYSFFIIVSFTQACIAFMSQNYGAGNMDMCRSIFKRCFWLSIISCCIFNVAIVVFNEPAIEIFTDDAIVASHAATRISGVLMYQFIACTYEISGGALRALGYSIMPMLITVIGTCMLRIAWCSSHLWNNFAQLIAIYPISWVITGVIMMTAYFIISRKVYHQKHLTGYENSARY